MDSINKVRDEKVRTLAKTLRESGLAASDSEAIRMAEGMTNTESKIQSSHELKKGSVSEKPRRFEEKVVEKKVESEDIPGTVERYDQKLVNSENDDYEEIDFSKVTTEEASGLTNPEKEDTEVSDESDDDHEDSEVVEEHKDEEIVDEPDSDEIKEEEPEDRTPPKKDISEYEESSVDLGSVFNSSKK